MDLIINNKIISADLKDILLRLRLETHQPLFKDIRDKGKNLLVTCPYHKGGQENHPSCNIFQDRKDPEVEFGFVKCFTCGTKVPLYKMVADCFGEDEAFGKDWLVSRFGDIFIQHEEYLEEIVLDKPKKKFLPQSILQKYNYYHPYLLNRKISKDIIDKFQVGYDPEKQVVTFPVWDDKNNLVMITSRSVNDKTFYIDKEIEKPVYLLNFIKNWNIDTVYVCESQINTLYAWSLGLPAIGLFGTGSKHQYELLRKSGIRHYILCFDGDEAGDKGIMRFVNNMNDDVFISVLNIPRGKDLNDLSEDEIFKLKVL